MKSFRTCVFQVQLNSNKKEAMLDKCMKNTELAYYQELEKLKPHIPHILKLETKKQKNEIYTHLKAQVAESVKKKHLSNAAKASIRDDTVAQISSTVELLKIGQEANLPKKKDSERDLYTEGMTLLQTSIDLESEEKAKELIYKKAASKFRPLNFLKTRSTDGAMILMDELQRYYVYLNLYPKNSRYATSCEIKNMLHVRSGEVVNFKSKTGFLFPLNLSKDFNQKEFMEKGQPKSYKLVKKDQNKYELHVAYEIEVETLETQTYLGIDRGINALASMSIFNKNKLYARKLFDGNELKAYQKKFEEKQKTQQMKGRTFEKKYKGYSDHIIHVISKYIVKQAMKHKSQVVLEELSSIANGHHHQRKKYARKTNFNRMLSRQQYQKLQEFLTYKLKLAGLPGPIFVYAAGTSIICNKCGHYDKESRLTQESFKCTSCGYETHADLNAADNIALKGFWLENYYDKKNKKMKIKFNEFLAEYNSNDAKELEVAPVTKIKSVETEKS